MTALLDATALAERLADRIGGPLDIGAFRCGPAAEALRLLASHARTSLPIDALREINAEGIRMLNELSQWRSVSGCADLDELRQLRGELDAWRRLAMAALRNPETPGAQRTIGDAMNALRALGIDPATGERIASEAQQSAIQEADPVWRAVVRAPIDDEPETEQERIAMIDDERKASAVNGFRLLTIADRGWQRAWDAVAAKYGDASCECPDTGERWQYMGSDEVAHSFLHRSLKGERVYVGVPLEPADFEPTAAETLASNSSAPSSAT